MKYEKARAEIVTFDSDVFMVMSAEAGKRAIISYYGITDCIQFTKREGYTIWDCYGVTYNQGDNVCTSVTKEHVPFNYSFI